VKPVRCLVPRFTLRLFADQVHWIRLAEDEPRDRPGGDLVLHFWTAGELYDFLRALPHELWVRQSRVTSPGRMRASVCRTSDDGRAQHHIGTIYGRDAHVHAGARDSLPLPRGPRGARPLLVHGVDEL
jgi:hypothetical protein